jgi:hypothetical protein
VLTAVSSLRSAMVAGAELGASEMGEFCVRLDTLVGVEWVRHSSAMRGSVKVRPAGDDVCNDCSVLGDWGVTFGTF